MNAKLKNFIVRTLSGAVLVASVLGSLLFFPTAFVILFALFVGVGLYEFHRATNQSFQLTVPVGVSVLSGIVLFVSFYQKASGLIDCAIFPIYALLVLCVCFAELFRKQESAFHNLAYFALGQLYVALPMSLLNLLLFFDGGQWQPIWVLVILLTIWVNDSFAYIFGILLGKHRLLERISPKKSWEGFWGGLVMSLLFGVACYFYLPLLFPSFLSPLTLWQWVLLVGLIVVSATLGDLLESLMKRTMGIKDYGNIMPGHGGVLDRFDSLLTSAVVIWVFLTFFLQ